jgi:CheY-like chemotaxis protein
MKTCLIVDDSKVIRKVARHMLETLSFRVEEAGDGREALDAGADEYVMKPFDRDMLESKLQIVGCA